jgi:hypothetical protein
MDFNTMPKLLADAWHLNSNPHWFFIGFSSGANNSAFLIPPNSAKMFALELEKLIKKHEAEHGEIDVRGVHTGIQSPLKLK